MSKTRRQFPQTSALAETHLDCRAWWYSDAVPAERKEAPRWALDAQREAEILRAWKAR